MGKREEFCSESENFDPLPTPHHCLNYRIALEEKEPERQLYLAVPSDIYYSFFELRFIQTVIKQLQIHLIIYDPIEEVIVEWKN